MENLNIIAEQFGFKVERAYAPGWKRTPDGYIVDRIGNTSGTYYCWVANLKEAAQEIATAIANNEHWGVK